VKTLDRYLLGELLVPFAFGLGAFSSLIFASGKLFQLLDLLTRQGYSLGTIGQLFILYLPGVLRVTFPMSVLLACLLGVTRLSADSEVTGLFAGGVSLYRLLRPLLVFSLLVTGGTFLFNETIVPKGEEAARRIIVAQSRGRETGAILLQEPLEGVPDRIIFAQDFNARTRILRGVDVFAYEQGTAKVHIFSREAKWIGQTWEFKDGYQESLGFPENGNGKETEPQTSEPSSLQKTADMPGAEANAGEGKPKVGRIIETYRELKVDLGKTPEDIERERKQPEEMTAAELARQLELVRRLEAKLEETVSSAALKVNLQMHYSVPLASVVFCLFGVPLGLKRQRSGPSTGLGLSVIVIFVYYVLLRYCGALAKTGELSPIIGAWLANVLVGSAGIFLLARSPK
jgi:lipopolysaccharide export system permease protein